MKVLIQDFHFPVLLQFYNTLYTFKLEQLIVILSHYLILIPTEFSVSELTDQTNWSIAVCFDE